MIQRALFLGILLSAIFSCHGEWEIKRQTPNKDASKVTFILVNPDLMGGARDAQIAGMNPTVSVSANDSQLEIGHAFHDMPESHFRPFIFDAELEREKIQILLEHYRAYTNEFSRNPSRAVISSLRRLEMEWDVKYFVEWDPSGVGTFRAVSRPSRFDQVELNVGALMFALDHYDELKTITSKGKDAAKALVQKDDQIRKRLLEAEERRLREQVSAEEQESQRRLSILTDQEIARVEKERAAAAIEDLRAKEKTETAIKKSQSEYLADLKRKRAITTFITSEQGKLRVADVQKCIAVLKDTSEKDFAPVMQLKKQAEEKSNKVYLDKRKFEREVLDSNIAAIEAESNYTPSKEVVDAQRKLQAAEQTFFKECGFSYKDALPFIKQMEQDKSR